MKYQTTKLQCQKGIDARGNVCDGCGGKITPLKTVDNNGSPTYWSGCEHCSVFTVGVPADVWKTARYLVMTKGKYRYNSASDYLKSNAYLEYWADKETRGIASEIQEYLSLMNKKLVLPKKREWLSKTRKTGYTPFTEWPKEMKGDR